VGGLSHQGEQQRRCCTAVHCAPDWGLGTHVLSGHMVVLAGDMALSSTRTATAHYTAAPAPEGSRGANPDPCAVCMQVEEHDFNISAPHM
jgi:hypothetical protein